MNFSIVKILLRRSFTHRNYFREIIKLPYLNRTYTKTSTQNFCNKNEILSDQNEFEDFVNLDDAPQKIDYDAITKGDPELLKFLKFCELEVDMLSKQGERVPLYLTTDQWIEVIALRQRNQRINLYRFYWLNHVKTEAQKRRRQERQKSRLEYFKNKKVLDCTALTTSSPVEYGLQKVTYTSRFSSQWMHHLYNYHLLLARMFGTRILIDCSYEKYMNSKELNLCIKQLILMWSENRLTFNPLDILFCNLHEDSQTFRKLKIRIPSIKSDPAFPFFYTEKNYLDLYPKKELVYLTPHCNEVLKKYDPNNVYIIGALVDKTHPDPLSLAKAKKQGIRVAKFPLDHYLDWAVGVKSLTLNQCSAIMSDICDGRDWPYAFRHVPQRKLKQPFLCTQQKFKPRNAGININHESSLYDKILKVNKHEEKETSVE